MGVFQFNVILLSVIYLVFVQFNVIKMGVFQFNVILLSVILLNVVAPYSPPSSSPKIFTCM